MLPILLAVLESEADKEKFLLLYDRYHGRMEQTAMNILRNHSDAEDALQNSFMQIIRHFEKVHTIPCEELLFWLISIVKNEALMILRKRGKTLPLENWDQIQETAEGIASYNEIVELFRKLPETYRAVLEMKILLGYADKEVADHLGISETAVSTRATRGRALLRDILEKEGFVL